MLCIFRFFLEMATTRRVCLLELFGRCNDARECLVFNKTQNALEDELSSNEDRVVRKQKTKDDIETEPNFWKSGENGD